MVEWKEKSQQPVYNFHFSVFKKGNSALMYALLCRSGITMPSSFSDCDHDLKAVKLRQLYIWQLPPLECDSKLFGGWSDGVSVGFRCKWQNILMLHALTAPGFGRQRFHLSNYEWKSPQSCVNEVLFPTWHICIKQICAKLSIKKYSMSLPCCIFTFYFPLGAVICGANRLYLSYLDRSSPVKEISL